MISEHFRIKSLGLMSGTSLDGLDLCLCEFTFHNNTWHFSIEAAATEKYSKAFKTNLQKIEQASAQELLLYNNEFGRFLGKTAHNFLKSTHSHTDIIASHGHTIFHQPEKQFTYQIGSGAEIAAITGIDTICDFRTVDIALQGQGAPLVPIGDELLFSEYDYCLNLGGFANISTNKEGSRIAWDICPVNIIINRLMNEFHEEYDNDGNTARSGNLDKILLSAINKLPFFEQAHPKSLGKEWLLREYLPILESSTASIPDKLHTIYHSVAQQIANSITKEHARVFVTGGGAFNSYLIELIKAHSACTVIIPEKEIVEFKEAVIFAFLGVLHYQKKQNTLASVTGALRNSIGGCLYSGS